MSVVEFGNHSSVLVPRQDRDSIRKFYCDVLGGKIVKADPERDFGLAHPPEGTHSRTVLSTRQPLSV